MAVGQEAIRRIPMFASLGAEDLARVAAVTRERHYARGELIIMEGDHGGALYYVQSGLVKVFKLSPDGKEQVLRLISAGYTFNDVPALDGGPNPANVAALEPSTIYMIGREELRRLIRERPAVAEGVIAALALALRHLVGLVEDLSFRHVTARVARILLEQEQALAEGRQARRLTQQEMAAMAGTAREVVGRALKELEAAGAISARQGRVLIINQERLRLLAGGGSGLGTGG
ncbi:Crp/Fnr family transcriptional regulator [Thermogemmatispora sp.]|uniref:Crp/Fnr family transcriptional regulator n=1 Tax=Thermogemmatispora sp. TaxID=1968838 RepID=UPI001DA29165|nr:Crp/Fnr family transcriptional regulator [Thermogemmatispora sp.]MBX5449221.1 Crp/Fnr family transcriptional regulator [Thermogemmatispora sp.]